MPFCGSLRLAVPCCAVLFCAVPCCGVLCRIALHCGVLSCAVLCCVALCRAAPCFAVPCCALGQLHPLVGRGVASALVALPCGSRARLMWLACGCRALIGVVWLAGSVLRRVWVCRPVWWVRRVSVVLPFLGTCTLVPCPLRVPVSRVAPGSAGWGGVVSSAWLVSPPSCLPASVSYPILGVAAVSPFPSGVRALVSVWWRLQWKVVGAVAWWLGFGGALCGAVGGLLCGCTPLPLLRGRWLVGAPRFG